MLSASKHGALVAQGRDTLVALEQRLRCASSLTPDLISEVIEQACTRLPALNFLGNGRVRRLVESGAWNDAALALLELELPQWKVRRLAWEDGEWLCSLSKQPSVPFGLDDLAEASHDSLPLALLLALVEAQRSRSNIAKTTVSSVLPTSDYAMCCDNFA